MTSGELIAASGKIVKRASGNIGKDYQIMIRNLLVSAQAGHKISAKLIAQNLTHAQWVKNNPPFIILSQF
jgi:hypothetical protein